MEFEEIELTEYTAEWIWKIRNFRNKIKKSKPGDALISPDFGFEGKDKWNIRAYLNGQDESTKGELGIFLHCKEKEKLLVESSVQCQFTILSTNSNENKQSKFFYQFDTPTGYGYPNFMNNFEILRDAIAYLPKKCLTISCKITKSCTSNNGNNEIEFDIPESQRYDNLNSMIKNKSFGDVVTLQVGVKTFQIYKGLLTIESPVFAAMFRNENTTESQTNLIKIKDLDADICSQMVEYLNTGRAEYLYLE